MRPLHIIFLLTAALSHGAVLTYTSLSTWQTANGGAGNTLGTQTFESLDTGTGYPSVILNGPSVALGGFEYVGNSGVLRSYVSGYVWSTLGSGQSLSGPATAGGITINVPAGIYALAFIAGNAGDNNQIQITVNGSTIPGTFTVNLAPNAAPVFIGIRETTTPITSITLAAMGTGNRVNIDNVMWAGPNNPPPPNETPEAATAILIGSALLLLPTLRRRFAISASPQNFAH